MKVGGGEVHKKQLSKQTQLVGNSKIFPKRTRAYEYLPLLTPKMILNMQTYHNAL